MSKSRTIARAFGFWTGWFVVLASMVGSGILTNSGPILQSTGSYPALLMLWGIGGLLSLAGALTLAEMATALPHVGGDYVYVREAFGPAVGFVYGWAMVLLGFAAPTALVAFTTANYLYPLFQPYWASERSFTNLFAALLIIFFTVSHCLGHRSSSRVQIVTTLFNLILLIGFAAFGLASDKGSVNSIFSGVPVQEVRLSALASGLILVMYAYTGWNAAVYLAGEIRNPAKTLPLCLGAGCMGVAVLYIAINCVYGFSLHVDVVGGFSENELNRIAEAAVARLFDPNAAKLFSLLVSIGVLAALSAYILTGPRIVYAMAKDGIFPAVAGRIDRKSGLPVIAILIQSAMALVFLFSGTFQQVLTFASFGLAAISILVVLPIFWLRRRADYAPRFRTPGYPFTPAIFLAVSLAILIGGAKETPLLALGSLSSIFMGLPLYFLFKKFKTA